jgi:hypothetical protein
MFAFVVAACVATVFACTAPREDELECEEAVSRLSHCCPGFDSTRYRCIYTAGCHSDTQPDISVENARCIRRESCAALVTSGACGSGACR